MYYGVSMSDEGLAHFLQTLPIALGSAYLSFFSLGIYRGVWRYVGINDFLRYFLAALGSYIILVAALFTLDSMGFTAGGQPFAPLIPFTFGIFIFVGLAASRSSFKLLDLLSAQRIQNRQAGVLIYGAGDTGEMALRWIMMNPEMEYKPVGFLDDDPYLRGRQIHGIKVLGDGVRIGELLERQEITGVILAGIEPSSAAGQRVLQACEKKGKWVKALSLDFEDVSRKLPENQG
jgi:UDP-GlcNAc:undecaprenyl-phosphate GlcNAc-1-phosphate transferase